MILPILILVALILVVLILAALLLAAGDLRLMALLRRVTLNLMWAFGPIWPIWPGPVTQTKGHEGDPIITQHRESLSIWAMVRVICVTHPQEVPTGHHNTADTLLSVGCGRVSAAARDEWQVLTAAFDPSV
ncbi:hypothetical protein [Phaeobacter sp.]|uniref:hypothetical protein n=1 Tax=Phaeobacter sp. TaxID=1902409 RepID=UPI00260038F9|nr:hypothetical protein [Phaeobacter sp.]